MLPENLGYIFDKPLNLGGARCAVLQDDLSLTFHELDDNCNRIANGLFALGISKGDRVALMFDNDYRFLECLLGTMRTGAVAVPLNIKANDESLTYIIDDSDATVLIASPNMSRRAQNLVRQLPKLKFLISDEGECKDNLRYNEFFKSQSQNFPRIKISQNDICMQPYTSGSTGRPKGVVLSHGGQIWNTDVMCKAIHVDERERALVCVPLFHKNAMICAVKPFLFAGGSLVILNGFDPRAVIHAIEKYQITYMTGVPAMYKLILAETELLEKHDVSSLLYAVCSSSEVPEELLVEFNKKFSATIAEMYGLTEGGPIPLVNTRWGYKKRGSCGRAFPGCDVKLLTEDGKVEAKINETGELVTRNPGVAKAYWNRPKETAEKLRDGWLYTGDLFRCDADGFYYFVGRKDDMINVAGENVYPKEIEDILMSHPSVRDVCVVSMQHEIKGEVPVAFVVLKKAGAVSEEDLKAFYLSIGSAFSHPRKIYFLNELPLSGTGKLDRNTLRLKAKQ